MSQNPSSYQQAQGMQSNYEHGQQQFSHGEQRYQQTFNGDNEQDFNQGQKFEQNQNSNAGGGYQQQPTQMNEQGQGQGQGYNSNQDYYHEQAQQPQSGMNGANTQPTGNYNYQQQSNTGMTGIPGQSGSQYPGSKAPDTLHMLLDKLEKKFGGERFDEIKHPENAEKNRALNESIIKKLKQVMTIVIQRAPQMAMQYGSKLF